MHPGMIYGLTAGFPNLLFAPFDWIGTSTVNLPFTFHSDRGCHLPTYLRYLPYLPYFMHLALQPCRADLVHRHSPFAIHESLGNIIALSCRMYFTLGPKVPTLPYSFAIAPISAPRKAAPTKCPSHSPLNLSISPQSSPYFP